MLFFAIVAGDTGFLTDQGTANYLEVAAQLGILTIAVTLLMIAGEFDLSVGSMLAAAGVLMAYPVVELGWPLWAGLALAFTGATLVGLINGFLVIRTALPSFIVTLAGLFILRGVTIAVNARRHGWSDAGWRRGRGDIRFGRAFCPRGRALRFARRGVLVGRSDARGDGRAREDALRQLDLRSRRRCWGSGEAGRAGGTREDHPFRAHCAGGKRWSPP